MQREGSLRSAVQKVLSIKTAVSKIKSSPDKMETLDEDERVITNTRAANSERVYDPN